MRALPAMMFLVCLTAFAGEPLSSSEWQREGAFLALGLIDYGQTRDIKNHAGMYETNPLLGRNPSDARIRNYFLASGVAHLGITYLLPRQYRSAWQWGTMAIELGVVAHNYSIGLRMAF